MEFWPILLPNPTQRYSANSDPRLAVTEFDRNFRQRQKYSGGEEVISVSWRFDQFQYDFFRAFVDRVLVQGSLEFTVTLIGLDGLQERVVRLQAGKTSMQYVSNGWYDVSAILIGVPATAFDGELFDFLLTLETPHLGSFLEGCEVLSLYIESFYGDSSPSPIVTEFLASYL